MSTIVAKAQIKPLPDSDIHAFRRFNRAHTKFIGTLREGFLESRFSLTEARVIYELATRSAPTAKEVCEELGLDPGYVSRILAKFASAGLVARKTSARDGRFSHLSLTARGRAAFSNLNKASNEQARAALGSLAPEGRAEVIRSMNAISRILMENGPPRQFLLRPHRIGDMGWIVSREGIGYAEQFGWDQTFEALVARIVDEFITKFDFSRERCWIAEIDGQHSGHVFLVNHPSRPRTAKLRLLFVEPSARGLGIGDALVRECIAFARTAGYSKVVLWTQSILKAAHRIYRKAGFRLVKEEPHRSFGQDLVGQEWELDLS